MFFEKLKKILFYKVLFRDDPVEIGYWTDIVAVLFSIIVIGLEISDKISNLTAVLCLAIAETMLLLPLIVILPNVFDPVIVREQTEAEHQAWRKAVTTRLSIFAFELLWIFTCVWDPIKYNYMK